MKGSFSVTIGPSSFKPTTEIKAELLLGRDVAERQISPDLSASLAGDQAAIGILLKLKKASKREEVLKLISTSLDKYLNARQMEKAAEYIPVSEDRILVKVSPKFSKEASAQFKTYSDFFTNVIEKKLSLKVTSSASFGAEPENLAKRVREEQLKETAKNFGNLLTDSGVRVNTTVDCPLEIPISILESLKSFSGKIPFFKVEPYVRLCHGVDIEIEFDSFGEMCSVELSNECSKNERVFKEILVLPNELSEELVRIAMELDFDEIDIIGNVHNLVYWRVDIRGWDYGEYIRALRSISGKEEKEKASEGLKEQSRKEARGQEIEESREPREMEPEAKKEEKVEKEEKEEKDALNLEKNVKKEEPSKEDDEEIMKEADVDADANRLSGSPKENESKEPEANEEKGEEIPLAEEKQSEPVEEPEVRESDPKDEEKANEPEKREDEQGEAAPAEAGFKESQGEDEKINE